MPFYPRLAVVLLVASGAARAAAPLLAEPIRPLPVNAAAVPARAALGRMLFHDLRLSRDNNQSCASCHQLGRGGADARPLPEGGLFLARNTPSIYNATFNFRQGWIGRSEGTGQMIEHAMGAPKAWELVASRLTGDPLMDAHFLRVYRQPVDAALVQDALSNYVRLLVTPSRFDRYLRGDQAALSTDEKAGYTKFKRYGCVSCHQGINIGGNMYQKFGAMRELGAGAAIAADQGRFELTGNPADRHMFRVPSLRNVALTAPYFHNGSVATLDEAVGAMFKYQLGRAAPAPDQAQIVRFLHTLNGEMLPPPGAQP
ncbi:MAG: cytochrome c peroxidase [Pseudomonadota bacterium]